MDYTFQGQNKDEKVELVLRRHPVVLLKAGYVILVLMLIPWLFFVITPGMTGLFGWAFLVALLISIWFIFSAYYTWVNDIYVITNQRVISTDQTTVLNRTVNEVPYNKVQEIGHKVEGLYHNMLHIGDVTIKTAARNTDMILKDVLEPYEVEQAISKHVNKKK